ncbi:hypothetical protein ACRJ4B_28360 [Streptomyces sp. GTA36]
MRLDLVHAVEKPLRPPELDRPSADRDPEQTSARLLGNLLVHGDSTAQVAVEGAWSEWVDDVTQAGPRRFHHLAHLDDTTVPADDDLVSLSRAHEFGDTRHRNLTYTPVAMTRFREYFHPSITGDPKLVTRTGPRRRRAGAELPAS